MSTLVIATFLGLGLGTASAGELVVQTTLAAEVLVDGLRVAQTYSAGTVTVKEIAPGERQVMVFRGGEPASLTLDMPEEGTVRLRIGESLLETDHPVAKVPGDADAAAPTVELRATAGQSFRVIVDDEDMGALSSDRPLSLGDLGAGSHSLQLRSADRTVIWTRGTLDLQAGDQIVLHAREGRMLEVFGRPDAWKPSR